MTAAKVDGVVGKRYTGKPLTQNPKVTLDGKKLVKGVDYKLTYANNVLSGIATVTVNGIGKYAGAKSVRYVIAPAMTNKVTVKKTSVKKAIKATALKKAVTVPLPKATAQYGKPKWTVVTKDTKNVLTFDKKTGKVKVKKRARPGTYIIKLKASVARTVDYVGASSKTVTVTVRVVRATKAQRAPGEAARNLRAVGL